MTAYTILRNETEAQELVQDFLQISGKKDLECAD